MTKILVFLFFLISTIVTAQTDAERKKIADSYDQNGIAVLKAKLHQKNLEKEARIANYFKGKTLKRKDKKNGKSYYIDDIVDGKPIYISTDNAECAQATKADKLHTGGILGLNLDGENMIVGVWDAESALASHVEFADDQIIPQSRVTFADLSGTIIDDHATIVAGVIIAKGIDPDAKGMAPKAKVNSYDWDSAELEMTAAAANGLILSNHSYTVAIFNNSGTQVQSADRIGAYPSRSREWDQITFNAPYFLPITSAGNEGVYTYTGGIAFGYDKLTDLSVVKNNLVVASANVFFNGSGGVQFFARSSFSSQGPTDDFRIKPDIAGYGENIYSPTDTGNTDYTNENLTWGTSFSAPNVTGSLILLQEYYNRLNSTYMKSATLRGLACHTALDDNSKIGPDPFLGWGLLDAEAGANVITDNSNSLAVITELTLSDGASYTYNFSANAGPISATICWTDPAGTASNSPNNVLSPRLVNDLDLRIEDPGAIVHLPWKLDKTDVTAAAIKGDNDVDNIENIDITSGTAGNYTLTVTHKGSLTNGSQDFSLILTGTNLTLNTVAKDAIANVLVWPNPVKNVLNIDLSKLVGDSNINILDMNGRKVYQEHNIKNSKLQIKTNFLNSGFYILSVKNEGQNFYKKIIIK
ncbi:S8 family serine peptidase [Seonamhaeicola maritimus]|nr:S8 family serine peptidase [Seonamhaeicola maritimus]